MSNKQRQIRVSGLTATSNIEVLRDHFERYGQVKNCFMMPNSANQAIVTMMTMEGLEAALQGLEGFMFNGRRLSLIRAVDIKKGKGASSSSNFASSSTSTSNNVVSSWGDAPINGNGSTTASASANLLAPGPRPLPLSNDGNVDGITNGMSSVTFGKDTWELSLEDSDFDDGWRPPKKDNKPPAIQRAEWTEAYDFVKSFAHYGGAMLAVDVESWDVDHDYIIELGLAYCSWQKGNAVPPRVKTEHIIIEEHRDKRNGVYSPDAKDRFAFGKSRTLTEFQSQVYLRILIKKLSQGLNDASQPLIFLFHNAASERNYFQLMNIDVLDNVPERIPLNLLRPTPSDFRNNKWSGYVVLDTQRLWKSFLIGKEGEKDAPMALGPICKSLGITTKYLHNAGNDALYTLKVFMKLAESESQARQTQRELGQSS
ncbi:hypothetical protein P389DRAFT_4266 [Cystobasidium minutum MCA 4210]|uniref:uncharacterized protein n=1 Tax=Cystobasidium minutum MCA 4210 TaxID=1397322 RepID=UPI0034CF8A17|eukprot:jgi/Rhomi1/4266/CE4265_313